MQWDDAAIILSLRKYGETSALVRVLAREHGVYAGVLRGATSAKQRGIAQPGNVVSAHWQARLSEQLGTFRVEMLEAHTAHIMDNAGKLAALSSACLLVEQALPERHPYPKLFAAFHRLLHALSNPDWAYAYVQFELELLAESGFGLDLSECAATGRTEELIYVSPKSGRAVSREAGEPYKDKMLPLPKFLSHGSWVMGHGNLTHDHAKETLAGMRLTGYFLQHSLLEPHGKTLPEARQRLWNYLIQHHGA